MRVSAKAEYACIAMLELAANYGDQQPMRVKTIADAHGIPPRFLIQILLQLKGVGLVTSLRGALGGYYLARPPERISLADVINAIDAPPSARPGTLDAPEDSSIQALHTVWKEIQAEEQRMLEDLNLAELLRRSREASAMSYQI